jgi:DNA-binding transcriptional LysR family regulator
MDRLDAMTAFARVVECKSFTKAAQTLQLSRPTVTQLVQQLEARLGVSDREVDVVAEGVDCVIRGGEPPASGLRMRRLGELPLGVFASPTYLDRFGVPEHPRELGKHHQMIGFLRQRTGDARPVTLRRAKEAVVVEGPHDITIDDGDAYVAASIAGLGIIVAPHYMCAPSVARGELRSLLEDWHVDPMPLVVLSPASRHSNERVRVFVEWVALLMSSTGLRGRSGTQAHAATSDRGW